MLLDLTSVPITIETALLILAVIVIPLSVWGVGVETRFGKRKGETAINSIEITNQSKEIDDIKEEMKNTNKIIQKNQKEVMDGIHDIELKLTRKKDRE